MASSKIEIIDYQGWMIDQVVALNVEHYGGDEGTHRRSFGRICSASFVEGKSIPIVTMDGNMVVGVQTYRYWPYTYQGKSFYSLQSGGTLVKSTYRGQGLFMRMLSRGNDIMRERGIAFVTGIPVKASYGGLIKDGWTHLCSPAWFIKVLRPARLFAQKRRGRKPEEDSSIPPCFEGNLDLSSPLKRCLVTKLLTLSTSREFLDYRYGDAPPWKYLFWQHRDGDATIVFVCKMSWTRGYQELLIGDVLCDRENPGVLARVFSRFLADVKNGTSVCAVTMLVGGRSIEWLPLLLGNGFLPYPKRIRFTMKNLCLPEEVFRLVVNKVNWSILHADLDTW